MTPEKALGRLINLREQLTDEKRIINLSGGTHIQMSKEHYCPIIDDLDDIIRSIERSTKENVSKFQLPENYFDDRFDMPDSKPSDESSKSLICVVQESVCIDRDCEQCGLFKSADSEDTEPRRFPTLSDILHKIVERRDRRRKR